MQLRAFAARRTKSAGANRNAGTAPAVNQTNIPASDAAISMNVDPSSASRTRTRPGRTQSTKLEAVPDLEATLLSEDAREGLQYEKLSQREHVLARPEPYVGALVPQREIQWVLKGSVEERGSSTAPNPGSLYARDAVNDPAFLQGPMSIVEADIEVSPAFYKIFDEILVNAADNAQRESTKPMTYIRVYIDKNTHTIRVENDGSAIPIVEHPKEKVFVPELIFGHLLTSSNFDDSKQRYVGGRHGFGAKMTNILSSRFTVNIVDEKRKLQYIQTWRNNMAETSPAQVTPVSRAKSNMTSIEFVPDMQRFNMRTFDNSILSLLHRRVVDVAASLGSKGISVYLNDKRVGVTSWKEYLEIVPALTAADPAHQEDANDDEAKDEDEDDDSAEADEREEPSKGARRSSRSPKRQARMVIQEVARGWTVGVGAKLEDDFPVAIGQSADGSTPQLHGVGTRQLSFVNGIATSKGGTHVTVVTDQVAKFVQKYLADARRRKRLGIPADAEIPLGLIRSRLTVFVSALVPNPVFDSQTKDALVTPLSSAAPPNSAGLSPSEISGDHGVHLSEQVLNKIVKNTGIVQQVSAILQVRAERETQKQLALHNKKIRATGRRQHLAIDKLDDANLAGTSRSHECTLILTEGDSAKALAIAGLAVVGRERFGVYPLRGKMLNVRDASLAQIQANKELNEIAEILGLRFGVDYADPEARKTLRYGSVMIMADQDHDGSHIKGLFLNIIATFWPGLLRSNEFVQEFITPIVKAFPVTATGGDRKGKAANVISFFTLPEYLQWKNSLTPEEKKQWRIKYYKGLGTSTAAEGREYFGNLGLHVIRFKHQGQEDDAALELAFSKALADQRKEWLLALDQQRVAVAQNGWLQVSEFVHHELAHFSMADTIRSIPSLIDGLKPSQRKVLFGCFKRNLTREIKVAQLSGYVSEHTGYHHGEVSLQGTIINMTHSFPGSNNVPLLEGIGQFGTRHMGGKDAASARYIYTKLDPITRKIFIEDDDYVLKYRDDDGIPVEPYFYAPSLPMALINGAEGIGTGFSTSIPTFHPLEVINNVRRALARMPLLPMKPWTWGFKGQVIEDSTNGRWITRGIIQKISPTTLEIGELPWGVWTSNYKAMLTQLLDDTPTTKASSRGKSGKTTAKTLAEQKQEKQLRKLANRPFTIQHFSEYHSERTVCFRIELTKENMQIVEAMGLYEAFKLQSYISANNLHLFDENQKIRAYDDPRQIIDRYVPVRLDVVQARKEYLLGKLRLNKLRVENRLRFIDEVIAGKLLLAKRKKADLVEELKRRGYSPFNPIQALTTGPTLSDTPSSGNRRSAVQGDVESAEIFTFEEAVGGADKDVPATEGTSAKSTEDPTGYDYLLNMPFSSLTEERMVALQGDQKDLATQISTLEALTASDIWLRELEVIESHLRHKMHIPLPTQENIIDVPSFPATPLCDLPPPPRKQAAAKGKATRKTSQKSAKGADG